MTLNSIKLNNYRNLSNFEANFEPINLVIAPNGTGKTNILESIFFTIYGSSFRKLDKYTDIIKQGENLCRTELEWDDFTTACVVQEGEKTSKKAFLNTKAVRNFTLVKKFPILVFAPNSVDIISGEPALRRKDLDYFLSFQNSAYYQNLEKYNKILRNRNAVIKSIQSGRSKTNELDFWNNELAKTAAFIFKTRYEALDELNNLVSPISSEVFHDFESLKINYVPNLDVEPEEFLQKFLQKLNDNQEKEIIVGRTLYGVHKDDFEIWLNNKNLRFNGSRGQQRLGSFLLKICYIKIFNKQDIKPLFLIDDLMSELDTEHREKVSKYLINFDHQVILTGAVKEEFPKVLLEKANLIFRKK